MKQSFLLLFSSAVSTIILMMTGCLSSGSDSLPDTTATETCFDVSIIRASGTSTNLMCTTKEFGNYNGLGVYRFARFTVAATETVSISAIKVSGLTNADPDLAVYHNGALVSLSDSIVVNREDMTTILNAGDYVLEVYEYSYFFPDFKAGAPEKLTSQTQLFKNDLTRLSNSASEKLYPDVIYQAPSSCSHASNINVSGTITFDRVPHDPATHALDYNNITSHPVRGAVVEIICNNGEYETAVTDVNGNYTIQAPADLDSFVRVKAQLLQTGAPSWDFQVVDNTQGQALYVMDGAVFNESIDITRNLHADSGWGGSSYTSPRVAAPFAILDSVYEAKNKIIEEAPTANFPILMLNWSINNTTADGNAADGHIGSSHFDGNDIYILGAANNDIDEYDYHVIIHEWGHYFEHSFSRSDSIGGPHTGLDTLDIRVAFSEGFGNAFSAIVTDDPNYHDALDNLESEGFGFNMENNNCIVKGWYSECSVQTILYDLYDAADDGVDVVSLNFTPIYNVLTNEYRNSAAFTSIFSFIKPLKDNNAMAGSSIDAITSYQNIDPVSDEYGSLQSGNNPGATDLLPVYVQP